MKNKNMVNRSFIICIKERRKVLGFSQNKLANMVGISGASIGEFERNECIPNARTAALICEALECEFEDLFHLMPF